MIMILLPPAKLKKRLDNL